MNKKLFELRQVYSLLIPLILVLVSNYDLDLAKFFIKFSDHIFVRNFRHVLLRFGSFRLLFDLLILSELFSVVWLLFKNSFALSICRENSILLLILSLRGLGFNYRYVLKGHGIVNMFNSFRKNRKASIFTPGLRSRRLSQFFLL